LLQLDKHTLEKFGPSPSPDVEISVPVHDEEEVNGSKLDAIGTNSQKGL
jgi:hypothetical protein